MAEKGGNKAAASEEQSMPDPRKQSLASFGGSTYQKLGGTVDLAKAMAAMQEEADVVVSAKGVEFLAHRSVLTNASPYLKDLLQEISPDQKVSVELDGITPQSFEALRSYMYVGVIRLNCNNVTDTYRCAFKLRIKSLISKCLEYLAEAEEVGRHIVLYVNALRMNMKEEEEQAYRYLVEHFDAVLRTREFLEMNGNDLAKLLRSNVLNTSCETNVFGGLCAWLAEDYQKRKPFEDMLSDCIRFGYIPEAILMKCFTPPFCPDAAQSVSLKTKIARGIFAYTALGKGRPDLAEEFRGKPREYTGQDPKIDWDPATGKVQHYVPGSYTQAVIEERRYAASVIQDAFKRFKKAPLKSSVAAEAVVTDEAAEVKEFNRLFAPTWLTSSDSMKGISRRDAEQAIQFDTQAYEELIPQVQKCQALIRRYVARQLYQQLHAKPLPNVAQENMTDEDDPFQNFLVRHPGARKQPPISWVQFPAQTLTKYSGSILDAERSSILLIGGIEPTKAHEVGTGCTIMHFCPRTFEITRLARLPSPRHDHRVAYFNGDLYVVGGFDNRNTHQALKFSTRSCFKYDIVKGAWSRIGDLHRARSNHGLVVLSKRLYVIGGQDEFDRFISAVEIYDSMTDTWTESSVPYCCKVSCMGICVHNGSIYVAGGVIQSKKRTDKVYFVDSVDRFDSQQQRWSKETVPLPSPRCSFQLFSHGKNLCALGGLVRDSDHGALDTLYDFISYNRKKHQWEKKGHISKPLHAIQVVVTEDGVFAFGGLKSASKLDVSCEILRYDESREQWGEVAHLPSPIVGFAAVGISLSDKAHLKREIASKKTIEKSKPTDAEKTEQPQ